MLIAMMLRDGPMREETDEDTEIRRPEPEEFDDRELGEPVGDTSRPEWPYEVS